VSETSPNIEAPEQVIADVMRHRRRSRPDAVYPDLPSREDLQALADNGLYGSQIMRRYQMSRSTLERLIAAYGITGVRWRRQKLTMDQNEKQPPGPRSRSLAEALDIDPSIATSRTREEIRAARPQNVTPIRQAQQPQPTEPRPPITRDEMLYWLNMGKTPREIALRFRVEVDTVHDLAEKYGVVFAEPRPVKAKQMEPAQPGLRAYKPGEWQIGKAPSTGQAESEKGRPARQAEAQQVRSTENEQTTMRVVRVGVPAKDVAGILRGIGETCEALGELKICIWVDIGAARTETTGQGSAA
jgi:transposase